MLRWHEHMEHGGTCIGICTQSMTKHWLLNKTNCINQSNFQHYIKPVEQTFAETGVQSMVNDSQSWKAYTCRTNVSFAYHHLPSAIWLKGDVFNVNHTP